MILERHHGGREQSGGSLGAQRQVSVLAVSCKGEMTSRDLKGEEIDDAMHEARGDLHVDWLVM